MSSMDRKENYQLFCQKARAYGVCDEMSGDDNHKRVRMGKAGNSRARFEVHLRKEYMLVFYDEKDRIGNNVFRVGRADLPVTKINRNYDLFSEIYPEDYDDFLQLVCLKLGRKQSDNLRGINTPLKPRDVIRSNGGPVKYVCGNCGKAFMKSPRCPDCGQLVKV